MSSFSRINKSALSELIVHKKSHIISMLLLGISGFSYIGSSMEHGDYMVDLNWVSVFFFFVSLIPLFFTCVNVFKDMHDVPTSDVQMSMPLSSGERFLSRMMTICYIWIFPYIFFFSMGNIMSAALNGTHLTGYMGDYTMASFGEMFLVNSKIFLWFLSIVLFITGVAVLCSSCIGSKAESIYLPVILMIVISVLPFETMSFITEKFTNISLYTDIENSIWHIFGFGAVFYDISEPVSVIYVLINCVLSVGLIAIAMFAYTKRDATTVGYPVVFRVFFEIFMILSLAALFQTLHMGNYGVSFIGLFIYYVGSTILRIIVSRKDITLMKILKWTVMYVGYYAVFILFSYSACITNGFGANKKMPDKSEIVSYKPVQVNFYCSPSSVIKSSDFDNLNIDDIDKVADLVAEYIEIQNKKPGFFKSVMFDGLYFYDYDSWSDSRDSKRDDYCRCNISIEATCTGKTYSRNIYHAYIILDKGTAGELYNELNRILR
ncbi:MAG: hypothetical protein PUE12_08275 [Oscillospiraceae bacterium]|nr:hypothetical protein [Oscillospiraceae bacterium]